MRLAGIFACPADADAARRALVDAGMDGDRISMTLSQTSDGIAAEAPGQSYENQPGQSAAESNASWFVEAIRGGDCALILDVNGAAERQRLAAILRSHGAREIDLPRP